MQLSLFTTAGCHLCEQAAELLLPIAEDFPVNVTAIEIGDDDALVERYGIRIPVIKFEDGEELDWPFDEHTIRQYIVSKINH